MKTTTTIRARVNSAPASSAKKILSSISLNSAKKILSSSGLKPADAVSMRMAQIVAHRGIPFAVQEDGYQYVRSEYGVTPEEVDAKVSALERNYRREKKAGTIRPFRGIADLRE